MLSPVLVGVTTIFDERLQSLHLYLGATRGQSGTSLFWRLCISSVKLQTWCQELLTDSKLFTQINLDVVIL